MCSCVCVRGGGEGMCGLFLSSFLLSFSQSSPFLCVYFNMNDSTKVGIRLCTKLCINSAQFAGTISWWSSFFFWGGGGGGG